MDFQTACALVVSQTEGTDTFLMRLQRQQSPVPGQVTALLLALKVIEAELRSAPQLDRNLAYGLHALAYNSRQTYEYGRRQRVSWPPLLDADIDRIAIAVTRIFQGSTAPTP